MNRYATALGLLFICLVFLASGSNSRAFSQEPDTMPIPTGDGMPSRPAPARPIPHHEPGQPSKAASYTSQVSQINAQGVEQTVRLTGLDALLQDGVINDPLAGNYRLVDLDNILVGVNMVGLTNTTTYSYTPGVTNTIQAIPGSVFTDTRRMAGVTAGDLNGDGQDEQISVWGDANSMANWVIG